MEKKVYRIICPSTELSKNERISFLSKQIRQWICSDALRSVVAAFGGEIPDLATLKEYIDWVNDFAEVWNYRKKQANGGERWEIRDDASVLAKANLVNDATESLGMKTSSIPIIKPDFVLPLGGAFLANISRPAYARKIVDQYNNPDIVVVALSGKRPLTDDERFAIRNYSSDAKTEYDIISTGVECAFDIKNTEYEETNFHTENINLQWAIRTYACKYHGNLICSLAAPSADASRRASSWDTFDFFMQRFRVRAGMSILLVTTSIYVPFQIMKFMPLAIEKGIIVDCVGTDNVNPSSFNQTSNYLQEIKGTINAIKIFSDKYF